MEHSETIKELATALAAAQGEIENAHKNAKNDHFRNRYADLAEIINTVRPVLSKHGLAVVQIPGFFDGRVTVDTMLTHKSGEWIRGTSAAPIGGKVDAQGVGSATTYLRRYSLAALCGIAQEDDDGNAASQPRQQPAQRSQGGNGKASDKQVQYLRNLAGSSVFTPDESRRLLAAVASEERERISSAIEWAKEQIDARVPPEGKA